MVKHIERGWTLEERKEWYNGSDLWHTLDDEWYDDLQFRKTHNIQIHTNSVRDLYQRFLSENDKSTNIESRTKTWYKERWLVLKQCKEFMNLKVETMTADDIQRTFLMWRIAKAKSQSKKLRGATLKGDLMAISGFTSWCYRNKIRKDKLENIAKILSKKLRKQRLSLIYRLLNKVGFQLCP